MLGRSSFVDVITAVQIVTEPDASGITRLAEHVGTYVEYPYEFINVRLADVIVDKDLIPFQRKYYPENVEKIVATFDSQVLDPPVLNVREDSRPYCIRGQHRIKALLQMFGQEASTRCRVYYGLSIKEEAKIWAVEDTTRKKSTPNERWKSGLIAELQPYVTMDRLARRTGMLIDPERHGPGIIKAASAAQRVIERWGELNYARTMKALALSEIPESPRGEFVLGLGRFLAQHHKVFKSEEDMAEFIRRKGYYKILDLAGATRRGSPGMTTDEAVRQALVKLYNGARRSENRLTLDPPKPRKKTLGSLTMLEPPGYMSPEDRRH